MLILIKVWKQELICHYSENLSSALGLSTCTSMQCWLCSCLSSQKWRAQISAGLHGFPGWNQAFGGLFPSLFEEGTARPQWTAHISSSSPSEGMRAHEPKEWFAYPPPGETFPWNVGKSHKPHTQAPGTWSLTSLPLGWQYHFHRVWFAPAPTKRRNSNNLTWACSGLLFLWGLPVTPGSCWCRTFPRQMPLVLEMAGNSFLSDFSFQR